MNKITAWAIKGVAAKEEAVFTAFREKFLRLLAEARRAGAAVDIPKIREASIRQGRLLVGPQWVDINIQDQCNYHCQFCFSHSSLFGEESLQRLSERHAAPAPYRRIKEILDDAYAVGTVGVRFCGEGDPLLHGHIRSVIEYALALGFKVQIFTNLSQGRILQDPDITGTGMSFLVNLAAVSAAQYEIIHGAPREGFAVVQGNIRALIRRGHHVALSCQIINTNYRDIGRYILMASVLGVKDVVFLMPKLYEPEVRGLKLSLKQRHSLATQIERVAVLARSKGVRMNQAELRSILSDDGFLRNGSIIEHRCRQIACFNAWFYSKVQTNGDVYICCHETVPIGRVSSRRRFNDVFFSARAAAMARAGREGVDPLKKLWHKCGMCRDKGRNIQVAREVFGK